MSPSATEHFFDKIGSVSAPLREMSSIAPLVSLLTMAFKSKATPGTERLENLMYTMSLPLQHNKLGHDVLVASFTRMLNPVLGGKAGLEDIETALGALEQPDNFRDFWILDGENLIKQVVGGDAHPRSLESIDAPFLDVFVQDKSRRLGLAPNRDSLILVPGQAQSGDEVWETDEGSHVMLRRRVAGGGWETIGEGFVWRRQQDSRQP